MSGTLTGAGAAPDRRQSPRARAAKQRKFGCGCLGSVTFAVPRAAGVLLLLNPRALHMGGRWTPALTWHGVGKLHSSTGATYGFFMELNPDLEQHRVGTYGSRKNLAGTARICTPQGEVYAMTVDGYLSAWLDADKKPIRFSLRSIHGAQPKLRADFYGSWQGQELLLDDKGSMAMSFAADGNAKGYLKGTNAPTEDTTGKLHYATESEFTSVCGENARMSF